MKPKRTLQLADHLAVMGAFVCVGHYLSEGLRKIGAGKKGQ